MQIKKFINKTVNIELKNGSTITGRVQQIGSYYYVNKQVIKPVDVKSIKVKPAIRYCYSTRKKMVIPHVFVSKVVNKNNGHEMKKYDVMYRNSRLSTVKRFDTLEEAKSFREICENYINRQIIDARCQKQDKTRHVLVYPETLLAKLGITLEKYGSNFYEEIVPQFEKNFEDIKGILDEKEITILNRHYKLEESIAEIAKSFNCSRQYIDILEKRAIQKIIHNPKRIDILTCKKNTYDIICKEEKDEIIKQLKEELTYDIALEIVKEHDKAIANDVRNIPIAELDISVRSFNCLRKSGIETLGEVASLTEWQILRIPAFGKKCLKEMRKTLKQYGLYFKEEGEE